MRRRRSNRMPHPLHVRDLYVAYLAARFGRNATPELYREEQWITIGRCRS